MDANQINVEKNIVQCSDACCQTETPTDDKILDRTPAKSMIESYQQDIKLIAFNNMKLSFELYKKHLTKFTININQVDANYRNDLASIMILKNRIQSELALIEDCYLAGVGVDCNDNETAVSKRDFTDRTPRMDDEQLIRRMASLTKIIQSATIKIVTKRLNM